MQINVDKLIESRRLRYECGEAAAVALQARRVSIMEDQVRLFLEVKLDTPAVIVAMVEEHLEASRANARITKKEKNAFDYLWKQLRVYFFVLQLKAFKIAKEGSTLAELQAHLLEQLRVHEGRIPAEPVCVIMQSVALKKLGSLTPQGAALSGLAAARAIAAHTTARGMALAALEERRRKAAEPRAPRAPRAPAPALHRDRPRGQRGALVPSPPIDEGLVGKALEMGYGLSFELDVEMHDLIGRVLAKEFDGTRFHGVVISLSEGLFRVAYEDGDEEDMQEAEVTPLLTQRRRLDTYRKVAHFYGEIRGVKTQTVVVGRKSTMKALLYIRWDEAVFPEENDESLEWVEVLPRLYGAAGKSGWEIVPVRPKEPVAGAGADMGEEEEAGEGEEEAESEEEEEEEESDEEESEEGESEEEEEAPRRSGVDNKRTRE